MNERNAPVDLVHLARHTLGDEDLEREVLQLFLGQSRIYLRRLEEAGTGGSWREAAHTLKGSAHGIGAFRVAAAADSAEQMEFEPGGEGRSRALAKIGTELDAARLYIGNLLTPDRAA